MGNANSHGPSRIPSSILQNAANDSHSQTSSSTTTAATTGDSSRLPLRRKRPSLELPDLVPQSPYQSYQQRGRSGQNLRSPQQNPPPSASIPIPIPNSQNRPARHEREVSAEVVAAAAVIEPSTHIPMYFQGGNQDTPDTRLGPAPPPTRNTSVALTVALAEAEREEVTIRSSIPQPSRRAPSCSPQYVMVTWTGGGEHVQLVMTRDDDDSNRRDMILQDEVFTLTIPLTPGTHHFRFMVDGQWRVADDLPSAVDKEGSFSNYISIGPDGIVLGAIPIPSSSSSSSSSATATPRPMILLPGHSFWSSSSTDDASASSGASLVARNAEGSSSSRKKKGRTVEVWTTEIPLELKQAAIEEETYLQSTCPEEEGKAKVVRGFVPLPQVPPVPGVPRHLEKLILNEKSNGQEGHGKKKEKGKRRARDSPPQALDQPEASSSTLQPPSLTTPLSPSAPPHSPLPVIADDPSHLPTPSHVVLHHLTTSAIRNGVLAVGETVRYREKFLTTVYYRPG